MQKNSQSFVRALIKFLNSKVDAKPTYEGITLVGKDADSDNNDFKIRFDKQDFLLSLYVSQPWREEGKPFINLIDENRPNNKKSLIQYTIDDANFIISGNSFILKQNKAITIGTKKEGLKEESENLMLDLGFNKENVILQGEFSNPDLERITKSLFKWLRIRTTAKIKLEKKYRNVADEQENIDESHIKFIKLLQLVGKEGATIFFDTAQKFVETLQIKKNDLRVTFGTSKNEQLAVTIGQRYCLTLIPKRDNPYGFIIRNEMDSSSTILVSYFSGNPAASFCESKSPEDYSNYFDEIVAASRVELNRTKASGFRDHNNEIFENSVFDEDYRTELFEQAFGKSYYNYWVFQCNPNAFDFETAIRNNLLDDWTVSAHKDKIKVGDKVILWISGSKAGCYALAEVTKEPRIISTSKDSHLWKTADNIPLKAGIKITHNWLDSPLLWDKVRETEGLQDLKVGKQGTNFSATKTEYETLLELATKESIPIEVKVIYSYLVKSMSHRKIQKEILEKEAPARGGGFLAMTILHDYEIKEYKKGVLLRNDLHTEINSSSGKYLNALNLLKKYYPELSTTNQSSDMSTSKNIILYGPPGTGKTYNSIDKAVEIATGKMSIHSENKKQFDELRKQGQIEFVTFHQNYSYEDFMVGLRPDADNEQLRFKKHRGIFYELCKRAKENYETFVSGAGKKKTIDEVFEELMKPLESGKEVEIKMISGISFWITEVSDKTIYFRKASGGTQHTLSVNSLKELIEGIRETPSGLAPYYSPIVDLIKSKRETNEKAEPIKKFVLVIDEINRANISKVFGELITLLEDDKRLGCENELKITLPNGEKDFGVPRNLYVIGTMNTADKSIALIDIALRRRFEFVGYYPKYEGYDSVASRLLQKINEAIFKEKKSADYLIGHAYFMNGLSIATVLKNKVVPLLMEYFSGKTDIVSKIFSDTDWAVNYDTTSYTWDISEK